MIEHITGQITWVTFCYDQIKFRHNKGDERMGGKYKCLGLLIIEFRSKQFKTHNFKRIFITMYSLTYNNISSFDEQT